MNRSKLTEQQIASIADVLANSHDWDSDSLSQEVEQALELSDGSLDELLKFFLSIDPQVRFAASFNHRQFVLDFQTKKF